MIANRCLCGHGMERLERLNYEVANQARKTFWLNFHDPAIEQEFRQSMPRANASPQRRTVTACGLMILVVITGFCQGIMLWGEDPNFNGSATVGNLGVATMVVLCVLAARLLHAIKFEDDPVKYIAICAPTALAAFVLLLFGSGTFWYQMHLGIQIRDANETCQMSRPDSVKMDTELSAELSLDHVTVGLLYTYVVATIIYFCLFRPL